MEKKVFSLEGVPSSEAEEVRRLLAKRGVRFYELPEGNFLGGGGIWVRSERDYVTARRCIEAYQARLREEARKGKPEIATGAWEASIARHFRSRLKFAVLVVVVAVTLVVGLFSR